VQISQWLKSEGDTVKQDETVAVIDSEKTTLDLPAPNAGKLVKILHQAGETVSVGTVVAHLEADGESVKSESVKPSSETKSAGESKTEKPKPVEPAKENSKVDLGKKSAPKEAAAEPKPVSKIETKTSAPDLLAAQKSLSKREEEIVPMTMLRRTVARHLVEAQQTMAMLTTFNEVDMSAVQSARKEQQEAFEKKYQVRLGLMSFFVKATIDALKQFPPLNSEIRGHDIIYRNYFDMGVAIATDRGLVVPVLRDAERLSFAEIEKAIGDFARCAKEGKLKPDELAGGTFTITNGGAFGSLLSTPIINPPQTGILGMHTIQERPVAAQGQVVIRPMMYVALTYDHRIVDGREAVMFLKRIKETIENPARMLIEI
ncbi:MAG TPA: 2-oxoglutarate dehydrogenase complex dihydrolipoyllysine-residue succinyltransferase, partial [Verrucomicrobiae bacterium]|nr:2-oxoglutarate dehydrogenase complex dihydrolipoyllysine-residue succinyltransferase [Verrucomicrobiae bacterium]